MQGFHYNYIKNKYGDKVETLLADTGSLMYKIEVKNFCEVFQENKELLDFGNYTKDLNYYNNSNNLVVDKIKDFMWRICKLKSKSNVRLKSEIHTFLTKDNHETKKGKAINKVSFLR